MTVKAPEGRQEVVLVVEDDPTLRLGLTKTLRSEGFRVEVARTGTEGLSAALSLRPDLVLLDVMLPRMDGVALCQAIRKVSGIPIVLLSARSDPIDIIFGLEAGADDYITKPFSFVVLLARIRALLRRGAPGQGHRDGSRQEQRCHDPAPAHPDIVNNTSPTSNSALHGLTAN